MVRLVREDPQRDTPINPDLSNDPQGGEGGVNSAPASREQQHPAHEEVNASPGPPGEDMDSGQEGGGGYIINAATKVRL